MTDPKTEIAPVAPTAKFLLTIAPLVEGLELSAEVVTAALLNAKIVKAPNDKAAEALGSPDAVELDDFKRAFPDATSGDLKLAINKMRTAAAPAPAPAPAPAAAAPIAGLAGMPVTMGAFVIPDVSDTDSFLEALKTSASLNVDENTIRSALEALFASELGLADIPEALSNLMLKFADDEMKEPVGEDFMDAYELVHERRYADVKVKSKFVTQARKEALLKRLRKLPDAVARFHGVVTAWNEMLKSNRSANPFGALSAGGTAALYPPADDVVAAAENVVVCLRDAFAGLGAMTARAMAYEGLVIRKMLDNPALPGLTGTASKERMLNALKINMTNADIRFERNVASYIVFVATKVPSSLPLGQEGYILEGVFQRGEQIKSWMNGSRNAGYSNNGNGAARRDPIEPYPMGSGRRTDNPLGNTGR